MLQDSISAIIPSYNGKDLLAACLPPLVSELAAYQHQVIVVDDGSGDGTAPWLATEHPQVRVVAGPHRGFAAACNAGLREAEGELVLLLNNDMLLTPGALGRLVKRLQSQPDLFAVGGNYHTPAGEGCYRCGYCGAEHPEGFEHEEGVRWGLDAPAGGGLFRAGLLRELGGFDELYRPFYWEDIDLGWNAWRAGYRIGFEAQAVMQHQHGATIQRWHRPRYYRAVNWKNLYLFTWKNCGRAILARHLLRLPWRGLRALRGGYASCWAWGLAMALGTLWRVPAARRGRPAAARGDEEIVRQALPSPELLLHQLY